MVVTPVGRVESRDCPSDSVTITVPQAALDDMGEDVDCLVDVTVTQVERRDAEPEDVRGAKIPDHTVAVTECCSQAGLEQRPWSKHV